MKITASFLCALVITMLSHLSCIHEAYAFDPEHRKVSNLTNALVLSNKERDWIKQNGTINVAVKSGWMPIEFRLESESNRGVSLDYLHEISKLTGLKFNLVHHSGNHVDSKKVQLISGVTRAFVSDEFTVTQEPFLIIPYAIYVNHSFKNKYQNISIEDLSNTKVAVFKNGPIAKTVSQDYPDIDLVYVDIADEAFEYLERNQIEAYIGNELVIDYHIEFHRIRFAKKSSLTPYNTEISMAVRNDEVLLLSIMNKALQHIGTNNPGILDHWKTPEPSIHPFSVFLVLVLSGILLTVSYWLFAERKKAKLASLESQKRIWYQANYDVQTGLPNRNFYEAKINEVISDSAQLNLQFALLFIDLDDFKNVNDISGHSTGDKLLKEVAERLNGHIQENHFIARLGGDEFVVIINAIQDFQLIDMICKKILNIMRLPFRINHHDYYISATVGISKYPQDSVRAEELLSYADQAMYEGKKLGRNRYSYFSISMQDKLNSKISMANELRLAINSDQFELVYQPILELKTLKCLKAEALIRWHHPQRGLINPDEFIMIAEETGMIHQLGKWILNQSIRDILMLQEHLGERAQSLMICINISPKQFTQPQHLDDFIYELKNHGISPSLICFEITEGLLLDASHSVVQSISRLKAEGVKFAIDDFGTGYSALAYLKKFDIDFVKIDKSFIRNIDTNNNNKILCESIILMSHKLNIKLIAEGVEQKIQEDILSRCRCDYIQGYLHGRPMSLKALIDRELLLQCQ